ncbi:hypothetical protein F4813DRAFT_389718 [Daldinia decipiens]|uniref:uncharacterized protein n=1 Tax=Daldinia decipiens TaxID=326647 RepID=UPI0020C42D76|nr:uncharacterized protein F4813DRAFT_389718 [Daldinia decipiens]KAI1657538.1 hypothetical protein F4813DRAFT_389718 [Daldinia decipiens]
MALNQDLSLPKTAPNSNRHRATAGESYVQAVYSILPLDLGILDDLVSRLNAAEVIEPGTCKLAPKYDFANRPLRDIYDYHLQLRDQDHSIHPLYFIVAIDADYKENGVLVVHLHTGQDGEEDRVDKARCSADWAAGWGLNLDIGNMAWEDLKEEEAEEWGDKAMSWTPESNQPKQLGTTPPRFQYACFSLVENALDLPEKLQPNYYSTPVEHRRVILGGNYSTAGGLSEVIRLFPWFCKSHPETHRQMVIVADKPCFEADDAVALLRFDWDGNVDAHDDVGITKLDLKYETVKAVAVDKAVAELDQYCRDFGLPQAEE